MTEQLPSVGCIVHYYSSFWLQCCAAIITRVSTDNTVDLIVFAPGEMPRPVTRVEQDASASIAHQINTWHWPEYVPAE